MFLCHAASPYNLHSSSTVYTYQASVQPSQDSESRHLTALDEYSIHLRIVINHRRSRDLLSHPKQPASSPLFPQPLSSPSPSPPPSASSPSPASRDHTPAPPPSSSAPSHPTPQQSSCPQQPSSSQVFSPARRQTPLHYPPSTAQRHSVRYLGNRMGSATQASVGEAAAGLRRALCRYSLSTAARFRSRCRYPKTRYPSCRRRAWISACAGAFGGRWWTASASRACRLSLRRVSWVTTKYGRLGRWCTGLAGRFADGLYG